MAEFSSTNELESQLEEVGKNLSNPPSSIRKILHILDKLGHLLSEVEQTPSESLLEALRPSIDAVLIDEVLRHSDPNVKISVAYCFSEIMRITAPKEPFNDDQMKEFFHLTVMSFQKLSSASGCNYTKISTILRIFSHFRVCVLLLDLELNELVVQMFQHFFNVVGSNTSDPLLSDIRNIMTMVIEESEEFPYEFLCLLITSVKNENQCASPCSWKLGEEVLKSCAAILKPYLPDVVKRMGINLNDYAKTVSSICQDESIEENLEAKKHALVAISSWEVNDTQMTLSCCHEAAEPKTVDADECVEASVDKPQELGHIDSTSRKRPKKHDPKYEDGYNSGLIVFMPDWTKHGKRTRNSSNGPALTSRIQRLPAKRHLAKEKKTTTNQNGGLNLCPDTLGDFMRAHTEERSFKRAAATLEKESDGTGDSKAKRRKQAQSTKKHGMHSPTLLPQADSGSQTNSSISRGKEADKQLALVALPTETVPPSSGPLANTTLDMVDVQGYKVKPCNASILQAIFAKHGDIAADCTFKSTSVKTSFLEVICEVVKKIQSKDVSAILSEIETLENEVADTHAAKVKVSWLQDHLERYKRLKEALEKCSSLKAVKANADLVSRAAKREVEERMAGLAVVEKLVKGLEFVTKKINSDKLESEAEESYWRMQLEEELL